jgi:hypothetical protein
MGVGKGGHRGRERRALMLEKEIIEAGKGGHGGRENTA